jgi:hypothetical protein
MTHLMRKDSGRSSSFIRGPRIPRTTAALLFLTLLAQTAGAGWEHGPIGPATRLPPSRSAAWEFAMVYTETALCPAELSCPAGAAVVIHFVNLADFPVRLSFPRPAQSLWIGPKAYRRITLGPQPAGDHKFTLEIHADKYLDPKPGHPEDSYPTMLCLLRAGTWPQGEYVFRAAWAYWHGRLLPRAVLLPAGRHCELTVAAGPDATPRTWQSGGYTFHIIPGDLSLTELIRPRGGRLPADPAVDPDAAIEIR